LWKIKKEVITEWIKKIVDDSIASSKVNMDNYIEDKINSSLELYSADKIGRPDYALELSGAQIIASSPSYKSEWWHFLVKTQPPQIIIDPDVNLGQCWPMKGSTGSVTIQLASPITPKAVSLEHVSNKIVHKIETTPQRFRVWGINGAEEVSLGIFRYDNEAKQIQTFELTTTKKFANIKLEILSNYGSKEYTCIYRFRVHPN